MFACKHIIYNRRLPAVNSLLARNPSYMTNEFYNLVKSLHRRLKDVWLVDKHFAKDTKCKTCKALFAQIKKTNQQQAALIEQELQKHIK